MSQPSPARRAFSSRSHLGVVKTPLARSASGAAPGALLRVNQEGMCLHVEPFDQFDPMPAASGLLGTNLRAALPRELAAVILDDLREGGLGRRSREVNAGGYRMPSRSRQLATAPAGCGSGPLDPSASLNPQVPPDPQVVTTGTRRRLFGRPDPKWRDLWQPGRSVFTWIEMAGSSTGMPLRPTRPA